MQIDVNVVDRFNYISFDVFDTLIHRRLAKPTDLFRFMGGVDKFLSLTDGFFAAPKEFELARVGAERAAREKKFNSCGSYEISLEEIYSELAQSFALRKEVLSELMRLECELEVEFCYPDEHLKRIYHRAMDRGARVVALSDMYLGADVLQEMLEKCGFRLPDKIFVSNELRLSKHNGDAYPHLVNYLGCAPSEILHLGDNRQADVVNAATAGLHSLAVNEGFNERNLVREMFRAAKPCENATSYLEGKVRRLILESTSETGRGPSPVDLVKATCEIIDFIMDSEGNRTGHKLGIIIASDNCLLDSLSPMPSRLEKCHLREFLNAKAMEGNSVALELLPTLTSASPGKHDVDPACPSVKTCLLVADELCDAQVDKMVALLNGAKTASYVEQVFIKMARFIRKSIRNEVEVDRRGKVLVVRSASTVLLSHVAQAVTHFLLLEEKFPGLVKNLDIASLRR